MGLFEDEEFEWTEDENEYLEDPQKGIKLIKSLMPKMKPTKSSSEYEKILKERLYPIIASIKVKGGAEVYKSFLKIADKIKEQTKIELLKGKKIVGIGGKFSAGKSCFINSITDAKLPEGQRPTTSIATYIIYSANAINIAVTNSDECISITDQAVEALTHDFYDKYGIGFSKLLKNLVIQAPGFNYHNIAILDTPGYSKSDSNKNENSTDAEIAREQLSSVDYLIWLVDANQGVITERDIDFIKSLNIINEILVVFTKANQRIEDDLKRIIKEAKLTLKSASIKAYDVIAYDSIYKEEILSHDVINNYLSEINKKRQTATFIDEIEKLNKLLIEQIDIRIAENTIWNDDISKILEKTNNIEHIDSLVDEYVNGKSDIYSLYNQKDLLTNCMNDIIKTI